MPDAKPKSHTDEIFDNQILDNFFPEEHQAKIKQVLTKFRTPLRHFVECYSYPARDKK